MKSRDLPASRARNGSYLAEFLLEKGYEVHGIKRRASLFQYPADRPHLRRPACAPTPACGLHLRRSDRQFEPDPDHGRNPADEIYNLGAQSHVAVSFESAPNIPRMSMRWGALRLLEAIRFPRSGAENPVIIQASNLPNFTGWMQQIPQTENDAVSPARRPYAGGQALCLLDQRQLPRSLWHVCLQRDPVPITKSPAPGRNLCDPQDHPVASPTSPKASNPAFTWAISTAFATGAMPRDYVRMQWMMLQQDTARTITSLPPGVQYSVREFIRWSAKRTGASRWIFRAKGVG